VLLVDLAEPIFNNDERATQTTGISGNVYALLIYIHIDRDKFLEEHLVKMGAGVMGCRDAGMSGCRGAGVPGVPGCRDVGVAGCQDGGMSEFCKVRAEVLVEGR
jgi:hypothetical protein